MRPDGTLATTPHPALLGAALTHPHITTDFSESQLELITGVHASAEACLAELTAIHQVVYRAHRQRSAVVREHALPPAGGRRHSDRALRQLQRRPGEERVPHRARASLRPAHADDLGHPLQFFAARRACKRCVLRLIRNFRRHSWLLLYLFGASPAVCSSFVAGRDHELDAPER